MADAKAGHASGTAAADRDLRRRNVAGVDGNGTVQAPKEVDDKKTRKQAQPSIWATLDEYEFIIAPIVFTALAFFTRMWKIGLSNIVTWDEAHFGKFGSHYLKREFYFDVHPPLGKMLVGLSGYLAGYNGSFEFKSGEKYPDDVNYTFMRLFNSAFGALCIPLAYFTAKELNFRRPTVWLVTMMVLCENSYATISRFILLDSMLLFFTFTTTMCWARFHRLRHQSFSIEWFFWLFACGFNIGCVCSVKWVGFFCTAVVGLYTVEDLWNKFGDLEMPVVTYASHVGARVAGLIVIPLLVYLASFKAHFIVLENTGPGDAQMSSLFQANLKGTEVGKDSPLEIAYGSRATLKNMGYGGGLLHSHVQTYPEGSGQQQVTCYHHKDSNNDWFFYPNRNEPDFDTSLEAPLVYVADKSVIRLIHSQTGRNLHSHQVAAPVTKADWEVSSYGNITVGDEKDHWTVEVVSDAASSDRSKIRTLTTAFRLKHTALGCYLRAGNVNLPQWGFKQIEVSCVKKNNPRDVYTHWNVEAHWNEKLPPGNPGDFKSPFFRDFVHLNVAMMTSNNALVPDPDKQDDLASSFWQWPILNVGLRMCSWDDSVVKYFLLGNPAVYWGSTAALPFVGLIVAWYLVRWQRGYNELKLVEIDHIHYSALYPVLGWFLHYLPFVAMGSQKQIEWGMYFGLYALTIGLFVLFRAIVFGMEGSHTQWKHLKWFETWKITD
ncbi:MAG: Protein O-mannosyltransferase 2 [Stictis urceolatum]|nr:Protein O-mannosyltransferase 2 [Stictis urceolata]